jgi:rhodanese-related sulfurtransferase
MTTTLRRMMAEAAAAATLLDPLSAKEGIDGGRVALIVDVREPEEFAAAHLPGAVGIPRGWLELRADPESPVADPTLSACRDRTVVVYCTRAPGVRSVLAAATLRELGFTDIAVLDGGLNAWRAAGLPISNDRKATFLS